MNDPTPETKRTLPNWLRELADWMEAHQVDDQEIITATVTQHGPAMELLFRPHRFHQRVPDGPSRVKDNQLFAVVDGVSFVTFDYDWISRCPACGHPSKNCRRAS